MSTGLSQLVATQQAALKQYNAQRASTATGGESASSGTLSNISAGINKVLALGGSSLASGFNTKLADTLFFTGGDDKLTASDIYGKKNAFGINTLVESITGISGDTLSGLRSGSLSGIMNAVSSMQGAFGNGYGSWSMDSKVLTERILSSVGGQVTSGPLKDSILANTGIKPELYDKILTTANAAYQGYRNGSFSDARSLYQVVAQITNSPALQQIIDVGAQTSIMAGVMNEAIRLGLPDAIIAMVDNSRNSASSHDAMRLSAADAVDSGNFKTVNLFVDKLGTGQLTAQVPDAAARFLSAYRLDDGVSSDQYAAKRVELVALLDEIDPHWLYKSRAGNQVVNLAVLSGASADAQVVLGTDAQLSAALIVAPEYPRVGLLSLARSMYPLVAV